MTLLQSQNVAVIIPFMIIKMKYYTGRRNWMVCLESLEQLKIDIACRKYDDMDGHA